MEKPPKHAPRGPKTICIGCEQPHPMTEPFRVIFWNNGNVSWFGGWWTGDTNWRNIRRYAKAGAQYVIKVTPK